jgi:bla regulator protein blaR1
MVMLSYSSGVWTSIAAALGDHLWQSTLFVGGAGLLALILRKNCARARYWIWLVASVKFLIPFTLLVLIGSDLSWSHASDGIETGLYLAMDEFSQPFTQPAMLLKSPIAAGITASKGPLSLSHLIPGLLAGLWLCGFLAVLLAWYGRWRQLSAIMRKAIPIREGCEIEALRRLERIRGIRRPNEVLLSQGFLEPAVFGIARPVLLWPMGLSAQLDNVQIETILAHELEHMRRRDNLAAALHTIVEAIFWFYPLAWWLGARLVEERERACDEEVLKLGGEPQVYAESILKACAFCVGTSPACVSGFTGADLKKRIIRIMTQGVARNLDFSRKLLVAAAALIAVLTPVGFGLANAPQRLDELPRQDTATFGPEFKYDVISIKPNKSANARYGGRDLPDGFIRTGATPEILFNDAYGPIRIDQIYGAPDWFNSERYDVDAKVDGSIAPELQKLSPNQRDLARKRMLQELLTDRFNLKVHRETRQLPIYTLIVAKGGTKLKEAKPGETYQRHVYGDAKKGAGQSFVKPGMGTFQGVTIAQLARFLEVELNRTIVDKTGLTGTYDFTLRWAPSDTEMDAAFGPSPSISPATAPNGQPALAPSDPTGVPPLSSKTLETQIGLKLAAAKGPVEVIVIDHVERPSEN